MKIILSQRIDIKSDYEDIPFSTYHFPKRYQRQVRTGDRFIYYQGNRHNREQRYYFGCGVVGAIDPDGTGGGFYARIMEGIRFPRVVPIYDPDGNGFLESLGHLEVRRRPTPPWQSSIRRIPELAFERILGLAGVSDLVGGPAGVIESGADPLSVLGHLNDLYSSLEPKERDRRIKMHLDRGRSVTEALKSLLGATCQACGWTGFRKKQGDGYIEAHHIV